MPPHANFLYSLTLVLCVAGITTVVFQRLHQPVVLGYILAGLIIGPHVPIPLVADMESVATLSELGVILVMFSLGLEFRIGKLVRVAPTAGIAVIIEASLLFSLGWLLARVLGWTRIECFYAGALICISSTTIIAKAFKERGITGKLRDFVVGVLIVEDLIAILLLAALTAVSTGAGLTAAGMLRTVGELGAFLLALLAVGMLVVPRATRAVVALRQSETILVFSIGVCFAVALLAQFFGYSVALGAFIAGMLVAESGHDRRIEHMVQPVRDLFAAIFFVSVGMLIDPKLVWEHSTAILLFTALVVIGKVGGVSVGAFLSGQGVRTSVQAGMSLAQIGEFSFIIAALGLQLGATRDFLFPIAVAVSVLTTLLTPWLIGVSGRVASYVDRKLPRPLQTFAALYASWLEQARSRRKPQDGSSRWPRGLKWLVIDALSLAAIVIGASLLREQWTGHLVQAVGSSKRIVEFGLFLGALLLAWPFLRGIVRMARVVGQSMAETAWPVGNSGVDFAAAPRRALVVTSQLMICLAIGIPLAALTQPFLPRGTALLVLLILVILLGIGFWRSATHLQGHVRAGAQMVVEVFAAHSHAAEKGEGSSIHKVQSLLAGLGEPQAIALDRDSPAQGKTLAELDLRGLTGATVLAIARGEVVVLVPGAKDLLAAGDVLAVAGSLEAVSHARSLLTGRAAAPPAL